MKKFYTLFLLSFMFCSSFAAGIDMYGDEEKIRCYPNPATTIVNFAFSGKYESGYTLIIYNSLGKRVSEQNLNASRISISLDKYFRGIYLYQLKDKSGKIIQTGRFQVSK